MEDHGRQQENQPPGDGLERSGKPSTGGDRPMAGSPEQIERRDPEVREKPSRRRFTAAYKLQILREVDQCTGHGELGALLRREGLYSSHLRTWKEQRERGALDGLAPKKRGRKAKRKGPLADEVERLRRKNVQLEHRLQQAETIIDVQKKLCTMLGLPHATSDVSENEE
jgi:transposase